MRDIWSSSSPVGRMLLAVETPRGHKIRSKWYGLEGGRPQILRQAPQGQEPNLHLSPYLSSVITQIACLSAASSVVAA